ncbi:MAG: nucleotidyltransferase domain-containing protein [Betaproteobacteria bacterium]|nr:nucleotidyltransferase domain-containing protein [Betaproteobacteria bacterium]
MTGNLASLLFGAYRRDALALLLLHPEDSLHVREIGRITGKAPGTILRELNRLADAGVIIRRPVGNQVQFQANVACPIYEDLRNILKKTAAIADVLREAMEPLAGRIQAAFVYGSVARGDERSGSDLDVMILGEAKFEEVVHVLAGARETLRREINPNLYPIREFRAKVAAGDPFLKRVLADKKIFLIGDAHDLGKSAPHRKAETARHR